MAIVLIIMANKINNRGGSPKGLQPTSTPVEIVDMVELDGVRSPITQVERIVTNLMELGAITKMSGNEVQVNRRFWNGMSLDLKRGFTLTCAQYSKIHNGTRRCTVVDSMTGEELASYGWSGIKVGKD